MTRNNILMIADPSAYIERPASFSTLWLTMHELWRDHENLTAAHDDIIWQVFNTHGKYMRKASIAQWAAIAIDESGKYVSSAFIIDGVDKWLIENVMTDPALHQRGAGSSVMNRIMAEAKKNQVSWTILTCDEKKNNGQLPAFYSKFGFKKAM